MHSKMLLEMHLIKLIECDKCHNSVISVGLDSANLFA